MASDRAGTDPIPATPRYQVLRPGVRLVGERLAPYDDGPYERSFVDILAELGALIGQSVIHHKNLQISARQFGKSMSAGTHLHGTVFDSLKPDDFTLWPPSVPTIEIPEQRVRRSDGKKKKAKQDEPGYVKLTRQKRR